MFSGPQKPKNNHFHEKKPSKKNAQILEVFGADRIHASPTPFSAISLLQAAHARNTRLPWWHLGEGAEGAEGSGRQGGWGWLVGLAAGWWQGGWGLGLAGGSGGMVAWVHGRE